MDNRQLINHYYDMWNRGDFENAPKWLDPNIRFRSSLDISVEGIDAFVAYAKMLENAFSNLHHSVEIGVFENNLAAAYVTYTGKHVGKILGYEPTQKSINYSGAAFFQLKNEKIISINVLGDLNALHKQLSR